MEGKRRELPGVLVIESTPGGDTIWPGFEPACVWFDELAALPWYVTLAEGIAGERLELLPGELGSFSGGRWITIEP